MYGNRHEEILVNLKIESLHDSTYEKSLCHKILFVYAIYGYSMEKIFPDLKSSIKLDRVDGPLGCSLRIL